MILCEYGCGQEAKYQLKNGKWCCSKSANSCPVNKKKNSDKIKEAHKNNPNMSNIKFTDIIKNCKYCNRQIKNSVLNKHEKCCSKNPEVIKKLEERKNNLDHICEKCGKKHNGMFGTGKFCSIKCCNSKIFNNETKEKISRTLTKNLFEIKFCIECNKPFKTNKKNRKFCSSNCASKYKSNDPIYRQNLSNALKGKSGGYRKGSGRGKRGWYKNYWCDSSWELAFVIYNLDHNIKFERNTKGFEYVFEDKIYKFHPDFILDDGTFLEIKGYFTPQNLEKLKQFKYPIQVLDKYSIKPILNYVIEKYGKDFIELYEI